MDDYYRKLFKSLHKNKEEMLHLMEEQSLFQLSQVGLKVQSFSQPDEAVSSDLAVWLDKRIAQRTQPGSCVFNACAKSQFWS